MQQSKIKTKLESQQYYTLRLHHELSFEALSTPVAPRMELESFAPLAALEAHLDEVRALHAAAQVDATTCTILALPVEEAKPQLCGALLLSETSTSREWLSVATSGTIVRKSSEGLSIRVEGGEGEAGKLLKPAEQYNLTKWAPSALNPELHPTLGGRAIALVAVREGCKVTAIKCLDPANEDELKREWQLPVDDALTLLGLAVLPWRDEIALPKFDEAVIRAADELGCALLPQAPLARWPSLTKWLGVLEAVFKLRITQYTVLDIIKLATALGGKDKRPAVQLLYAIVASRQQSESAKVARDVERLARRVEAALAEALEMHDSITLALRGVEAPGGGELEDAVAGGARTPAVAADEPKVGGWLLACGSCSAVRRASAALGRKETHKTVQGLS